MVASTGESKFGEKKSHTREGPQLYPTFKQHTNLLVSDTGRQQKILGQAYTKEFILPNSSWSKNISFASIT